MQEGVRERPRGVQEEPGTSGGVRKETGKGFRRMFGRMPRRIHTFGTQLVGLGRPISRRESVFGGFRKDELIEKELPSMMA